MFSKVFVFEIHDVQLQLLLNDVDKLGRKVFFFFLDFKRCIIKKQYSF